jgi:TetR/AcrR family transcriptional repressor of nem operon
MMSLDLKIVKTVPERWRRSGMPRISQREKELNRSKILDAASVMFRERGVDQVGIDQLMHSAGLTRGGFYNHFESKEALVAQACQRAFTETLDDLDDFLGDLPPAPPDIHPLIPISQRYLSAEHRDSPGTGCPMPALAVDISRHTAPAQREFAQGVEAYLRMFEGMLSPALGDSETRDAAGTGTADAGNTGTADIGIDPLTDRGPRPARLQAIETLTNLVGALVLARAVREAEPALSEEFLDVGRDTIADIAG